MPVLNGIGQSAATIGKQETLKYILMQHLAVVRQILVKYPRTPQVYNYIDANAGCGYNALVECVGSPLVFMEAVDKVPVSHYARFVEIKRENVEQLRWVLDGRNHNEIICGNNKKVVPEIVRQFPPNSYGLLYSDPNGVPDFDMLAKVSRMPQMAKIDILLRFSATSVKRKGSQTGERLIEHLKKINKRHWILQSVEKGDPWQWTFLLLLNSDCLNPMRNLGCYYGRTEEGQRILEILNYTKEELQTREQLRLFDVDQLYHTYSEYLATPQFRAVRERVMEEARWTCQRCGVRAATQVHHLQYPEWGDVDVPENLIAICEWCHYDIHKEGQ